MPRTRQRSKYHDQTIKCSDKHMIALARANCIVTKHALVQGIVNLVEETKDLYNSISKLLVVLYVDQ